MENLEFIIELDRFVANWSHLSPELLYDDQIRLNGRLLHQWSNIYETFLQHDAPKEINISCGSRRDFCGETLPSHRQLVTIRKLIYELLLDNYNEFVSYTREATNDRTARRRRLEIVPPEFKTLRRLLFAVDEIPRTMCEHGARPHDHKLVSECHSFDLAAQWDKALEQFEHSVVRIISESDLLELPRSRTTLAGTISTRVSSRGSSIGSIVDNLKDYSGWKTVKKLRFRRSSNEQDVQ